MSDETTIEVEGTEVVTTEAAVEVEVKIAEPVKDSKVKGLTNGDWFAGYPTADLRAYLRFWKNENRSKGAAEALELKDERFEGMTREDHIEMLEEEIAARDAARSKGGPNA